MTPRARLGHADSPQLHTDARAGIHLVRATICGGAQDLQALLMSQLGCERVALAIPDWAPCNAQYWHYRSNERSMLIAAVPSVVGYAAACSTAASVSDLGILIVGTDRNPESLQACVYLLAAWGVREAVTVVDVEPKRSSEIEFRRVEALCAELARRHSLARMTCIPVNVARRTNIAPDDPQLSWFSGPSLTQRLAGVSSARRRESIPTRLAVESVAGGAAGCVVEGALVSGDIAAGATYRIQPLGAEIEVNRVSRIEDPASYGTGLRRARVWLTGNCTPSCGDLIASSNHPAQVASQFNATIVWCADEPMLRGRTYLLRLASQETTATIAPLKYKLDLRTLEHLAAEKLARDEVGVCEIELSRPIAFDPYNENDRTGRFQLIDKASQLPVAVGMLNFSLWRAHNVHAHALAIDKASRSALKNQTPCLLWLTGISAAGKSTIADHIDRKLHALGRHTYVLDGDNVRHGLNKDLGFNAQDRVENIRRIAEVARLMVDAGLIVIAAFISPFRAERRMARELLPAGEFIEIFVDTPLALAEKRDPKGLYRKARRGEIRNFTGIDSPYEAPEAAEIHLPTASMNADSAADAVLAYLRGRQML